MRNTAFTTDAVKRLGEAAGLSVTSIYALRPRVERLYLDGLDEESAFGIVEISRVSQRVLRGWIQYGADGPRRQYRNATAVRGALQSLAAQQSKHA
ncbi:hypothetical protein [Lentzea terrae]|uniref:hypothetical protein n=1 Tax=Lentzea terrae TaxID=2200761 RepID=UPI000DD44FAE|nr:hypothetical protein [Lentzea terrae]